MKNLKILSAILTTALILTLTLASCGGGGPSAPSTSISILIYSDGKFLDGISVVEDEYDTYTGRNNNLQKGNVTKKDTYIEIIPAEGKDNEWNEDNSILHYKLEFKFSKTLDLRGYDGIEVEWEGVQEGWEWISYSVGIEDATGKTKVSWGGYNKLASIWVRRR